MPFFIQKSCTKCGICLPECPTGSIVEGKDQFYIDADSCADHAACVAVCPVDAIHPIVKPAAAGEKKPSNEQAKK